jgi:hypothetical protein
MKIVMPMIATIIFATLSHADEPLGFPKFSWDTIPVYLHFGKRTALTDEELKFVAETSNFVCLEKGHGSEDSGSTEKGIARDAKRLKELSPGIKVLFYWNAFLNYKVGDLEQYNLLDPDFRRWWVSIAAKSVQEYGCDGIFMDAVNQAKRPLWMRRGWGIGNESKLTDAVTEMMQLANEAIDKMTFSLACYLVAAEANCYFCYSWGYRDYHGSLVDYPQFHKPLGPPHGDAVRTLWKYQRSFEHAEVTVDLATREANIQWKNRKPGASSGKFNGR